MEIILALIALGATPVGAAMLNKPTRSRFVKYLQVHIIDPAKGIDNDPELKPLQKRDKNWDAENKLCVLWQDAFDWFSLPNAAALAESATRKRDDYQNKIIPLREAAKRANAAYDASPHFSERLWNQRDEARRALSWAQGDKPYFSEEEKRALVIAEKYGYGLLDNGLIRNVNKNTPLAVDPIVYAL